MTSTTNFNKLEILKEDILSVYQELISFESLEPCEKVNNLFTRLVHLVTNNSDMDAECVLTDPLIAKIQQHLRNLCAIGESQLELNWSTRISCHKHPEIMLTQFPYYQNYEQLTRLEFYTLKALETKPIQRVLFIGAGALPLTAILLARYFGVLVDSLDIDVNAWQQATTLIQRLSLQSMIDCYHMNALECTDVSSYDAIFVAALAGVEYEEKQKILMHLSRLMQSGTFLLIRTAESLKTLLYPRVLIEDLERFTLQLTLHPSNEVINSVVIAKQP
jgi:nicotianamine synthase